MDEEIVAVACGICLRIRAAHHVPDFCACGARHDLGAPICLVHLALEPTSVDGALKLATSYACSFVGTWGTEERAAIEGVFHEQSPANARSQTAPSQDRRPTRR